MRDWDLINSTSGNMAKPTGKIKFSIVIAISNMNDHVREAMPYFQKQNFENFEIIVVSEQKEKEKFPKTRMIYSGRAPPSKARNIGAQNAKGEIIAFIDDDAYPAEDWLEKTLTEFDDEKTVAVGGPSLVPHKATFFQKVSNKVYELSSGKTGIRYGKGKRQKIDDWPTCNFFVRKKDFDKVGGFDERYWGGEDTQVCYSLLKTGKSMIYNPEIIIYHHPRKTLKQHVKQSLFWGMWRGFFMRKHKQSRQLVFFIPALFVIGLFIGSMLSFVSKWVAYPYLFVLALYGLFLLYKGFQTKSMKLFFPVVFVMFLTQIFYGAGFIRGILSNEEPIKKTLSPSENLKTKKA